MEEFFKWLLPYALTAIGTWALRGLLPRGQVENKLQDVQIDALRDSLKEHTDACNRIPKGELVEKINALNMKMDLQFAHFAEHRLQVERDLEEIRTKMHGDLKNIVDAIKYIRGVP